MGFSFTGKIASIDVKRDLVDTSVVPAWLAGPVAEQSHVPCQKGIDLRRLHGAPRPMILASPTTGRCILSLLGIQRPAVLTPIHRLGTMTPFQYSAASIPKNATCQLVNACYGLLYRFTFIGTLTFRRALLKASFRGVSFRIHV